MSKTWVHNTVARMLNNDENNLVSDRYLTKDAMWSILPTDTANGAIANFPDGADDVPVKSLTVSITPVQEGSGDPSPSNVRPINGWTAAEVNVNGTTITREFKDAQGNTLTVYGGEAELIGGKLRVTMRNYTPSANANITGLLHVNGGWAFTILDTIGTTKSGGTLISSINVATAYGAQTTDGFCALLSNSVIFKLMDATNNLTDSSTPTDVLNAFNTFCAAYNPQAVYSLATPIEYDLTPEDNRTLYGDNTIYADCGDVSVTYRADIGLYIDKKLTNRSAAQTSSTIEETTLAESDTVETTLAENDTVETTRSERRND